MQVRWVFDKIREACAKYDAPLPEYNISVYEKQNDLKGRKGEIEKSLER